jgi:hypothetical protein
MWNPASCRLRRIGHPILAAFLATLVSCDGTTSRASASGAEVSQARTLLADQLRDPASVQFRNVVRMQAPDSSIPTLDGHTGATRIIFCGEFNARNGFGGYTGFSPFFIALPTSPTAQDEKIWGTQEGYGADTAEATCDSVREIARPEPVDFGNGP